MPHKKLSRQIERRRERRQEASAKKRQEQVARDMWLGSDASYKTYKAIREDVAIADNEKIAVFQAEMYRQKPKTERSFMDSVYVWMVDHRKTTAFKAFASLCGFVYNLPDKKPFMAALRIASYLMAVLCVVAAVKTGRYVDYFYWGVLILFFSYASTVFNRRFSANREVKP
jgi:hypothetical protein